MNEGRIILISGAPGTGKSTAAAFVAQNSAKEHSVLLHTDDFYKALRKGAMPPHLPGADRQNLVVIEAFLAAAARYARGGYDVIVDGVVGPWFLEPWLAAAREGCEIHYIILRADKEETLKRAVCRPKLDRETNRTLVETMWEQFRDLGPYEANVIDNTSFSFLDTASAVLRKIEDGTALLGR